VGITVTKYPNFSKCHPLNELIFMYDGKTIYANHREQVIDEIDKDNMYLGFDYRTFLRHRIKFADMNVFNYWQHNVPKYKFEFDTFYSESEDFPYFYPLQKMVEQSKEIKFDMVKSMVNLKDFEKFHDDFTKAFYGIERNGIKVDRKKFINTFNCKSNIIHKDRVYQNYNFFTSTSRPSNAINNINYAALTPIQRECFIPDNDVFVDFDFDAYHPRLIANMIGYKFPKKSVHKYLSKSYGVDVKEGKNKTFQYLYGGIPKEVANKIKFFGDTKNTIQYMWEGWNANGFEKTHIYKRLLKKENLTDMNPQKLFNYYIQSYETERNVSLLNTLHNYLLDKETKIVLYNYDSFLFDYSKKDGKGILSDIKKILEGDGFVVNIKFGKNYGEMSENASVT
jgi:hypothetical protein